MTIDCMAALACDIAINNSCSCLFQNIMKPEKQFCKTLCMCFEIVKMLILRKGYLAFTRFYGVDVDFNVDSLFLF